jgi:spore germination protein KA
MRKLKNYFSLLAKPKKEIIQERMTYVENTYPIKKNIHANFTSLKKILGKSDDLVFRKFEIVTSNQHLKGFICFITSLVNTDSINTNIIKPLLEMNDKKLECNRSGFNMIKTVKDHILTVDELNEVDSMDKVLEAILTGQTALFISGYDSVLTISTQGFELRKISEPETEASVRGPREGFNENIQVNAGLIRRKLINPNLIFEKIPLGRQTKTSIYICYLDGIANPKIVKEVKSRINRIDTDSILESGYIEQFIEDHPFSPFPTIGNSEKPDTIAIKILDGRVAILCDGTPFVLTVPFLFIESVQSAEDLYYRSIFSTFRRLLRMFSFYITISTPALYVALTSYHQGMIPTVLLVTMASSHEGVPFTAFLEALLMGITFEILREAGIRMPRPIGQAISIVGALVIGEAAVQAGIVSSPMIIVIALTGITSFIIPAVYEASVLIRFGLVILVSSLGLFGFLVGFFIIFTHMCSLRSFGTPYFAPFAPVIWTELKDSIIRAPIRSIKFRPQSITWTKSQKQGFSLEPSPSNPKQDGEES